MLKVYTFHYTIILTLSVLVSLPLHADDGHIKRWFAKTVSSVLIFPKSQTEKQNSKSIVDLLDAVIDNELLDETEKVKNADAIKTRFIEFDTIVKIAKDSSAILKRLFKLFDIYEKNPETLNIVLQKYAIQHMFEISNREAVSNLVILAKNRGYSAAETKAFGMLLNRNAKGGIKNEEVHKSLLALCFLKFVDRLKDLSEFVDKYDLPALVDALYKEGYRLPEFKEIQKRYVKSKELHIAFMRALFEQHEEIEETQLVKSPVDGKLRQIKIVKCRPGIVRNMKDFLTLVRYEKFAKDESEAKENYMAAVDSEKVIYDLFFEGNFGTARIPEYVDDLEANKKQETSPITIREQEPIPTTIDEIFAYLDRTKNTKHWKHAVIDIFTMLYEFKNSEGTIVKKSVFDGNSTIYETVINESSEPEPVQVHSIHLGEPLKLKAEHFVKLFKEQGSVQPRESNELFNSHLFDLFLGTNPSPQEILDILRNKFIKLYKHNLDIEVKKFPNPSNMDDIVFQPGNGKRLVDAFLKELPTPEQMDEFEELLPKKATKPGYAAQMLDYFKTGTEMTIASPQESAKMLQLLKCAKKKKGILAYIRSTIKAILSKTKRS